MKEHIVEKLRVSVNGVVSVLPEWAGLAVELGMLARRGAVSNEGRLVICCVVPCRRVFSLFIGLGAVLAGGLAFRKGFTWDDFLAVEPGTEVFWKEKERDSNYLGVVEPQEELLGQTLVPVSIIKPVNRKGRWFFSKDKFYECLFSEEKLPSPRGAEKYARSEAFFNNLGIQKASSWLMTSGAEVRLVTNRAALERDLEGWGLLVGEGGTEEPLNDLILLKHEEDASLAKATITSHLGYLATSCPVTVLDGPLAFHNYQKINSGSLVFVLERAELSAEHVNFFEQASYQHSQKCWGQADSVLLSTMPKSVEITGYYLRDA